MFRQFFFFLLLFFQFFCYANKKKSPNVFKDSGLTELNLSAVQKISGYHIFSHGKPGELLIDGKWLNAEAIAQRFNKEVIGQSELYIYGCNFAQGEKGLAAIQYLENNLNISISASTNITGIDGDWKLEVGTGKNALSLPYFKGNLQLDNTHYLNPITFGAYNTATITEEYIYLSTPSAANITVKINYATGVGNPSFSVRNLTTNVLSTVTNGLLTFNNANPLRLQFSNTAGVIINPGNTPITVPTNTAGTIISGAAQGLIFSSTNTNDQFFVNYRVRSNAQAGSVLTKGKVAMGKEFRWGGSPVEFATTVAETGNLLSIMATEDNTQVVISNIKGGTKFINGTSGTTLVGAPNITRILQKGETFMLYAPVVFNTVDAAQDKGWLGAKVLADKDVSVVVGGLMQQGNAANDRDIGLDQLVPIDKLGLDHIIMQGNGGTAEKVIIVATESNTDVFLNGNATAATTLVNAGDYILVNGSNFINKNMFVRASKPSYIFHKIYGSNKINTNSLMFIPPLSCFGQKKVDLVPDANSIGTTSYSNTELVVLAGTGSANKPVATLNGTVLTSTSPTNGQAITGNLNWVSYRYNIGSVGNVKVTSLGTIQAEIIGANDNAGFGGYYSGFGESPIYMVSLDTTYDFPCLGKSTMTITPGLGTYQWFKDGIPIPGATSNSYTLDPVNDAVTAVYYATVTFAGGCSVSTNQLTGDICPCPKPGTVGTPDSFTDFGISSRDNRTTANWPKDVPNGFISLEANTKGFVITRMLSPESSIADPRPGMLVYDTDDDCLKLYNGTSWKCIKQTCND